MKKKKSEIIEERKEDETKAIYQIIAGCKMNVSKVEKKKKINTELCE
jgi:hypothetical protein